MKQKGQQSQQQKQQQGTQLLQVGAFILSMVMLLCFTSGTVLASLSGIVKNHDNRLVQFATSGDPIVEITKFEFTQPTVQQNEDIPVDIEVQFYLDKEKTMVNEKAKVDYYAVWARNTSTGQVFYGSTGMSENNDALKPSTTATSLGYYTPGVYRVEGLYVAISVSNGYHTNVYLKADDCSNKVSCDNMPKLQKSFTIEEKPFEDKIPVYEYTVGVVADNPEVSVGDKLDLNIRRIDKYEEVNIERKELKSMMLNFTNEADGTALNVYVKSLEGNPYVIVPSTATAGKYTMNFGYLTFEDGTSDRYQNTETKTFIFNASFTVKEKPMDTRKYEFNNELYGESIVKDLAKLDNDAIITVNANALPIIDENVFKAIKDTNQTLIIEYETSQWVFSGADITSPKTVDVSTLFEKLTTDSEYYDEFLQQNVTGTSALLKFSDNGDLPGKVLIKIDKESVDVALNNPGKVYVYYYKEDTDNLVKVAMEIQSNKGFYEFYINHNSKYIMTAEEVVTDVVSEDLDMLALNHQLVIQQQQQQMPVLYIIGTVCGGIAIIFLGMMLGRKKQQQQQGQQQAQG